jgi:hypothetical protein
MIEQNEVLELRTQMAQQEKMILSLMERVEKLENHNGTGNSVYLDGVAEVYRADILRNLEEKR